MSRHLLRHREQWTNSRLWLYAKRVGMAIFFISVLALLAVYARKVNWSDVIQAMARYPLGSLLMAFSLAVFSYVLYGVYDLIGRAYCRHKLAVGQVMLVSFICYAFTLTLSAWVGGIGMRYRLYSRLGLSTSAITRIFSLSLATNWLGFILLAGIVSGLGMINSPASWPVSHLALRLLGLVLSGLVAVYLLACAFAKRRRLTIRRQKLILPSLPMAVAQLFASCANWLTMATIIYILLNEQTAFTLVLGVLLVSSIAGLIIHVPAGLGVLEAVFLTMLGGQPLSHGAIIAALMTYRALYYIGPLLLAIVLYFGLESRAGALRRQYSSCAAENSEEGGDG